MMNNVFHPMILVIFIDLLIRLQQEFIEHIRAHKCAVMAAPVVMMEKHIRMKVAADTFRKLQFPLCQIFNEIMHLIFIFYIIGKSVHDLAEIMCLLEDSGSHKYCLERLVCIYSVIHRLALIPLLLREIQRRSVYIVFPVLDILYHDLIGSMYRERSGSSLGKTLGYAPGILHIFLSFLKKGAGKHKGMEQKPDRFILIYKSVGISSLDTFDHILFCC